MTDVTVNSADGLALGGSASHKVRACRRAPARENWTLAPPKPGRPGPQQQDPPARAPSEGCPRKGRDAGRDAGEPRKHRVECQTPGTEAPGRCRGTNPPSESRQGPEVGGTAQGPGFS